MKHIGSRLRAAQASGVPRLALPTSSRSSRAYTFGGLERPIGHVTPSSNFRDKNFKPGRADDTRARLLRSEGELRSASGLKDTEYNIQDAGCSTQHTNAVDRLETERYWGSGGNEDQERYTQCDEDIHSCQKNTTKFRNRSSSRYKLSSPLRALNFILLAAHLSTFACSSNSSKT